MKTFFLALLLATFALPALAQDHYTSTTMPYGPHGQITDSRVSSQDGSSYHSVTTIGPYGGVSSTSTYTPAPKPLEGYNPMGAGGYHPMGR
jgi:hypothetical protein